MFYFESNNGSSVNDWPLGRIDVRKATLASSDLWGPHVWQFKACSSATASNGIIPYNNPISTIIVKAFLGNAKPSSDLSLFIDITTDLIDPDYTPTIQNDNEITLKFQWPGDVYKGQKASLVFVPKLQEGGGTHPFYWKYIHIQ